MLNISSHSRRNPKMIIMNDKNNVKGRVIKILKKHPEGLTILDISKEIGMSRHAVTKYVYQLLGERKIFQREVGTAKLCYLREKYGKK